jgi:hypothetical protein
MYQPSTRPIEAPAAPRPRPQRPDYLPHAACVGPCIPSTALWQEWREIYATRSFAALIEEARTLQRDEHRLARSMIPDLTALGRIDMRLTLIDERLNAPGLIGL